MSITCGFYNSINGDRKYDATSISRLFDGIIIDGVYSTIGTAFVVKAKGGHKLEVGIGRAWFNHTWIHNDAILPITAPESDTLLNRIDAIVIEINEDESVRENTIKYIKGTPSSSPKKPTMVKTDFIHQYPLCYIIRKADSNNIIQANIINMVGSSETPFVTGVLKTIKLDDLVDQWEDILNDFTNTQLAEFRDWFNGVKSEMQTLVQAESDWEIQSHNNFNQWFERMKGLLSTDAAGAFQLQLDDAVKMMIKSRIHDIFKVGLDEGRTIFSNNFRTITITDKKLVLETNLDTTFQNSIMILKYDGGEIARCVKNYSETEISKLVTIDLPLGNVTKMELIKNALLGGL